MLVPTVLNRATLKAHFTKILNDYNGAHVQRVLPWLDDLITGAETLVSKGGSWTMSTSRQVYITLKGVDYKLRFNHKATFRGGIELVRMNGNRDGAAGRPISTAEEAKEFATYPQHFLPGYVAPKPVDHNVEVVEAARAVIETRAAHQAALKNLTQALARRDGDKRDPINVTSPPVGRA